MTRDDKYNMLDKFALTDKLLYKLNKLDFDSGHRIRGCMNPDDIKNADVCIEKYIDARKKTKTDKYTELCKLVGMDLPEDYTDNNLTIRDLFTICGKGTPVNHIQFIIHNCQIDADCRYDITVSKYSLSIKLTAITKDYIPDNIPRFIEISLSHDNLFAFVKSVYSDDHDYSDDHWIAYLHHTPVNVPTFLTPIYDNDSALHHSATTNFLKCIFKPIQEKWRNFALNDCPLTCTACDTCEDIDKDMDDDIPDDCSCCDKECMIPDDDSDD